MTEAQAALAEAVAAAVAAALPHAERRVKWNAPSFALDGRDIVTLNLPPKGGAVRVVFHRGAKAVDTKTGARLLPDAAGLVWATDQRASVTIADTAALDRMRGWLTQTCRAWAEVA